MTKRITMVRYVGNPRGVLSIHFRHRFLAVPLLRVNLRVRRVLFHLMVRSRKQEREVVKMNDYNFKQAVAERIIEHSVQHWTEIPDRENTIEQALLRMSNTGVLFWPLLSNALLKTDVPHEISELLNRIVERLQAGEIKLGECTKAISEYADACVNSESVCVLSKKIRQEVVLPISETGGD